MNIYLSMAKTNDMDNLIPPLNLLVLASVLEKTGHRVKIIFPVELDDFLKGLPQNLKDCDIFGISANSFNWHATKHVIREIHRHYPNIVIVLGGPHPTFFHKYCLESTSAQIVIRNEGEITFPLVIQALAENSSLSSIQGVTYKTNKGDVTVNQDRPILTEKELDSMPVPAYQLIPRNKYGFIPMETSRGCFFRCIFCGIPFPRRYRKISLERVERILSTLNSLTDRFVKRAIFLSDDSFSAHKDHAIGVLKLVEKQIQTFPSAVRQGLRR